MWFLEMFLCKQPFLSLHNYLSGQAEAAFGLYDLFQDVALDASGAHVFVDHSVLQVDVVNCQTDQSQVIGEGKSAEPVICRSM